MNNKRAGVLLLLLIALCSVTLAKNSPASDMGDWYYKQFNFKKAALYYTKALKRDNANEDLVQRLADCYRLSNNWVAAETQYARLASSATAKPLNKLYYAEALRANQRYADAKTYYEAYLKSFPQDSSVKERIKGLEVVEALSKDNGIYKLTNEKAINSPVADFGVGIHGDNEIYFSTNRKPDVYVKRVDSWTQESFLAIYKATVDSSTNTASAPAELEGDHLNKKFHEAAPHYNAKLNELYFDRSNYNGKRAFPSADKTVKLEIFKAGWSPDQNKWNGEVKAAVPFNNKEYSVCHPSLTPAGDTLYFTSDMPGGYGRSDIYMSVREANGEWGIPRNLGANINTTGDDMFPFIAPDGLLYFSSNGHPGLGGLDIFSSKPDKGKWGKATNLGNPVNTNADDFGFVLKNDKIHGYLCSNRSGGAGDDDIYSFIRKGMQLEAVTYNGYSGEPIGDAKITADPSIDPAEASTDTAGKATIAAEAGKTYTFTATKEGYRSVKTPILITEKTKQVRIPLFPLGDIKLEVTVIDKKTKQVLDSSYIHLTNIATGKEEVCWTDKDGKCYFNMDTQSLYGMDVSKETGLKNEKYLSVSVGTSSQGIWPPAVVKELVELDKVKLGVPIKIDNIYYDLDKWNIRPDAALELNKLVKILKDNPTIEIELGSHTDCRASRRYNMDLSGKRAKSAVEYIASQGIDIKRMVSAGYGESKLVNKCKCEGKEAVPCTEEQHQENRRTEFKIMKF
jgi:outer membrane protein OmpA-like peptidoglycan-associated protein